MAVRRSCTDGWCCLIDRNQQAANNTWGNNTRDTNAVFGSFAATGKFAGRLA